MSWNTDLHAERHLALLCHVCNESCSAAGVPVMHVRPAEPDLEMLNTRERVLRSLNHFSPYVQCILGDLVISGSSCSPFKRGFNLRLLFPAALIHCCHYIKMKLLFSFTALADAQKPAAAAAAGVH